MYGTLPTGLVGRMSTVTVSPKSGHRQARGREAVAAPGCAIKRAGLLSCLLLSFFFISAAAAGSEVVQDGLGAREGLKETASTALEEGHDKKALDPNYVALLRDQMKVLKEDEDTHALLLQSLLKEGEKASRKHAAIAGIAGGAGLVASGLSFLGASKLGANANDSESMENRSSGTSGRSARSFFGNSLTATGFATALLAVLGFATAVKYGVDAHAKKKDIPRMVKNFREAIAERRQGLEKTKLGQLPEEVSAVLAEEDSRTSS